MTGKVGDHQLLAERGRYDYIEFGKYFADCIHGYTASTAGLNVFNRRKKTRRTKRVGPIVRSLFGKQLVSTSSRKFIERSRGLRFQHRHHRVVRELRHFHGNQVHTHRAKFFQCGVAVSAVVRGAIAESFPAFAIFLALFLFLGRSGLFFALRWRFLFFGLEILFQVTDAKFPPVEASIPIKSRVRIHRPVLSIRSVNRMQDHSAVFHASANRSKLVHAPGKRHGPGPRHETKSRTQPGATASRGRRRNRAERFRSYAERNATGSGSRCRSCRRTAGTLTRIPRITRDAAEPAVAHRQRAERKFRH